MVAGSMRLPSRDVGTDRAMERAPSGLTNASAWLAIAIMIPVAIALAGTTLAIDLAYQVRAGQIMLDTHHILTTDTFTFTVAGRPWLDQQWGAQILFAVVYRIGGWFGLAAVRALLAGMMVGAVFLACRARGVSPRTAALLAVAGYLVGIQLLSQLRPQEFAFVLFALSLWLIASRHRHPAWVWLVPAITVIWANLHGSFVLASLLLVFAWLEDRSDRPELARRCLVAALVSFAVSAVNPSGVRIWTYVVDVIQHPVVRRLIGEWSPPTVRSWTGRLFLASAFAVGAFLARREGKVGWIPLIELGTFATFALLAGRGVGWWGLAAPVIIAGVMGPTEGPVGSDRSLMNTMVVVATGLVVLATVPLRTGTDPITAGPASLTFAPENIVAAAKEASPPGSRAFVSEVYSSWTEFSAPDLPVAIDPRIEIFPVSVWDDYLRVTNAGDGWSAVLDRWGVDVLILHPGESEALRAAVETDPRWRLIFDAVDGSVFERASIRS